MEGVDDVLEEQLDPVDDEEYRQLRSQVDLNPFDYSAHQNWILAEERRHGRGSEASECAREGAHAAFPQPEPFWVHWMDATISAGRSLLSTPDGTRALGQRLLSLVKLCQEDFQCTLLNQLLHQLIEAFQRFPFGPSTLNGSNKPIREALLRWKRFERLMSRHWSNAAVTFSNPTLFGPVTETSRSSRSLAIQKYH